MSLPNEIVLRPRFQQLLAEPAAGVLQRLEQSNDPAFELKRMDDHIFIKIGEARRHFWSPQLQLEILDEEDGGCKIYGLFGPNPTLWTFFMFLHFGVATLFIIFGIWAYSSAALGRDYGILVGAMVFMVVLWFVLYAFGRAGRARGKPQMRELHNFFQKALQG
ncbi:GTP-binding protein [Robiginitalea sp. IMCC44478]|uniref:GTP-binding protein n=1 Tax=Robiginitalea sp. IMCC44478 TaxID=3459122 RepID=UPI0040429742